VVVSFLALFIRRDAHVNGADCKRISGLFLCGLGQRAVGRLMLPDGPADARHLVGHGDGGLVVDMGLLEVMRSLAQPVGLLLPGVEQGRARTWQPLPRPRRYKYRFP